MTFINDKLIQFNTTSSDVIHQSVLTDNKIYLQQMIDKKEKVDIVFADVLYNTAQKHDSYSYSDKMTDDEYELFMRERFELTHKIMKPSSVLVVFVSSTSLFTIGSILDSIFNKRNRISIITWNKASSNLRARHIRNVAEYILIYGKNIDKVESFATIKNSNINESMFTVENKQRYRWRNCLAPKSSFKKQYCYPYIFKDGTFVYPESKENYEMAQTLDNKSCIAKGLRSWNYSPQRLYQAEINGELKHENGILKIKEYVKPTMKSTNILQYKNMNYISSAYFLNEVLEDSNLHFTFSKPVSLYTYILTLLNLTKKECEDKTIIDIFAGSGVTLSSILQINKKYKKNHHVTLLEVDPLIYDTQLYILKKLMGGYERINRAGNRKIIKGLNGKIQCIKYINQQKNQA